MIFGRKRRRGETTDRTGIARPRFWDRARYYGLERELADALDAAE